MIRQIVRIDEEKCNGCGLCVNACHESAIGIVDGKAKLLRDDFCDGFGDCLPACPTGAISFVEREAAAYDEEAVQRNRAQKGAVAEPHGCPGTRMRRIQRNGASGAIAGNNTVGEMSEAAQESELRQWPVQIKLAPLQAPYFEGADLLIAADCTAYAYANFHRGFMRGRVTLVGCPKLDDVDYSEKLAEIIRRNEIRSVTIVRMEVPCCGGLEHAAVTAMKSSGKFLPWQVVTISIDGRQL